MNPNPIIDSKISNCNLASLKPSVTRNKKTALEASTNNSPVESVESAAKRAKTTSTGSTATPILNPRNLQIKSYAAKLKEQGTDISEETVAAHIEELKKVDPPKALHYFCEMSEVFRGKPAFDIYSYVLLRMAQHYREFGQIKEFEKPPSSTPEAYHDYSAYQNPEEYQHLMQSHYTDPSVHYHMQAMDHHHSEITEGMVPHGHDENIHT